MIKIEIEISDEPLPGTNTFYGRIQAMPENIEPVSKHEIWMRDLIMHHLEKLGRAIAQSQGIQKAIVARVPLKKKGRG